MHINLLTVCFLKLNAVLVLGLFLVSCGRTECTSTNDVFIRYEPGTNEYKEELARQIRLMGEENLTYWFDRYERRLDKEYIIVHIQGNALCAQGVVLVEDATALMEIKKTGGMGYRGARLMGLEIEAKRTSTGTELIFKDLDYIID